MQNDNQAVHKVLSGYILENANLKIALEEQKILIADLQQQLKEATEEDELPKTNMA